MYKWNNMEITDVSRIGVFAGADIVEVNQVIMLRPTKSPIVFIQ